MNKRPRHLKLPSRWGPRWSRWVGRFLARGWWRTEVRGIENIPATGGAMVVGNHVGLIDGPVVHGIIRRASHFLVTDRMFKGPLKAILVGAAQIKVDASGRDALAKGLGVLRRGDVVGVFPEGTRGTGSAESTQGGAAWLAVHSGAPVIPVALFGTRHTGESVNVWPRPGRKVLAAFGKPVQLTRPEGCRGAALIAHTQVEIETALRNHVAGVAATTALRLPVDNPIRERGNR